MHSYDGEGLWFRGVGESWHYLGAATDNATEEHKGGGDDVGGGGGGDDQSWVPTKFRRDSEIGEVGGGSVWRTGFKGQRSRVI